jgi:hypothetical protein
MHMNKTACVLAVTLFVSGLCIAPFVMAGPVSEKRMRACNKAASKMSAEERGDFLKECLPPMTMAASSYEQQDQLSKREKFCNRAASKISNRMPVRRAAEGGGDEIEQDPIAALTGFGQGAPQRVSKF